MRVKEQLSCRRLALRPRRCATDEASNARSVERPARPRQLHQQNELGHYGMLVGSRVRVFHLYKGRSELMFLKSQSKSALASALCGGGLPLGTNFTTAGKSDAAEAPFSSSASTKIISKIKLF